MTELETLRHSCAHVLAEAILRIWPEAQFAAGPPVEQGFYYDVDLPHRISPEDFAKIEAEMQKIIAADQPFERKVVSRAAAMELGRAGQLAALGERGLPSRYKLDILENIAEDQEISLYRNGAFTDARYTRFTNAPCPPELSGGTALPVVNGQIVIRPMMYVALSYDHRIIDGRESVTFLVAVKKAVEDPRRLLLGL
jgi:hypothetical protein